MISIDQKYEMLDALAAAVALKFLAHKGLPLPERVFFTGSYAATAVGTVLYALFPGSEIVFDGDGYYLVAHIFFSDPQKSAAIAGAFASNPSDFHSTALVEVEAAGNELVVGFDELFDDLIPTLKALVKLAEEAR